MAAHMLLTGMNSYSPQQYSPPSRRPSPGPDRRGTAGRWGCRRSRWSKSTAPASQASDQWVTSDWLLQTATMSRRIFPQCVWFTISELEPLWSFMAFSCTFPMAASAHSAMEMSRTPEVMTHTVTSLTKCCSGALAKRRHSRTCYIEVGGDLAVGQREPDEAQAHAESGRDVGKIVSFAWNARRSRNFLMR